LDLLNAIHRAINQQRERKSKTDEADKIQQRLKALTPREYEVFPLLVTGPRSWEKWMPDLWRTWSVSPRN
jgi:FixJ family two-component response regulator